MKTTLRALAFAVVLAMAAIGCGTERGGPTSWQQAVKKAGLSKSGAQLNYTRSDGGKMISGSFGTCIVTLLFKNGTLTYISPFDLPPVEHATFKKLRSLDPRHKLADCLPSKVHVKR
jgi:hypothetical protein